MKNSRLMFVCWIAGLSAALPALAQDMPHRKPGLWETSMSGAQMQGKSVTVQQCIDEKTDADMLKKAISGKDTDCTQQSSKRTASGFEFSSTCKHADGSVTSSHGVISGVFNSAYTMDVQSHRTPAMNGKSDFQTTISARYAGACSADMKAGDMKMNGILMHADGMPANISPQQAEQMKKMMEQMKKQMKQPQ